MRDVLGTALTGGEDDLSGYSDIALLSELGRRLDAAARLHGEGETNGKPEAPEKSGGGGPTPLRQYPTLQDKAAREKRDD